MFQTLRKSPSLVEATAVARSLPSSEKAPLEPAQVLLPGCGAVGGESAAGQTVMTTQQGLPGHPHVGEVKMEAGRAGFRLGAAALNGFAVGVVFGAMPVALRPVPLREPAHDAGGQGQRRRERHGGQLGVCAAPSARGAPPA